DNARDRGRENDRTLTALAHMFRGSACREKGRGDVEVHREIKVFDFDVFDIAAARNTGVAPQHINAAQLFGSVVYGATAFLVLAEISDNAHSVTARRLNSGYDVVD